MTPRKGAAGYKLLEITAREVLVANFVAIIDDFSVHIGKVILHLGTFE